MQKEATRHRAQGLQTGSPAVEESLIRPEPAGVYFYLGNSYDNQFKIGVEDPANLALLPKAVQNYALAVEKLSDPKGCGSAEARPAVSGGCVVPTS